LTLWEVAVRLSHRLGRLFLKGRWREARACRLQQFANDPHWRDLLLFHEYFNGDTGEGLVPVIKPDGRR